MGMCLVADSPASRPSPTHASESKGRIPTSGETLHGSDFTDHGLSNNEPSNSHDAGPKGNNKAASSACNHIGCSSEEETESTCIANDHKRRKLILFISVLAPTNHDGANLYYTILSDIEDSPPLSWLDELDKDAQEEVSLLYTLASRHPAFTFEQRTFLGTVANRVNDIVNSKFSRGNTTPQTAQTQTNSGTHPVYFNHAAFPHVSVLMIINHCNLYKLSTRKYINFSCYIGCGSKIWWLLFLCRTSSYAYPAITSSAFCIQ